MQSIAIKAHINNIKSDSLSEVFVRGKKIGYSKLLKDCFNNYTKVTPQVFIQNFYGQSILTRNEKFQFELNGTIRVDFVNYSNFNHFLLSRDCKYSNKIRRSKNEDLTLYPLNILRKLELQELKSIIRSNKYQFTSIRENNEIVELSFAPKNLIYQPQKELKSLKFLNKNKQTT